MINQPEQIKRKETKKKGIANVVGRATKIASEFAEEYFKQLAEATIDTPADIRTIILDYQEYCLKQATRQKEEFTWPTFTPMYGLDLKPGITQIYGPPDTYKSFIGINIANWFSTNTELSILYVDAENKLINGADKALKGERIYITPGRADTHNIVKKMVVENLVNVIILDTIIAISKYEDMLRSIIKYIDNQGIYIIALNQTRFDTEGENLQPAGYERISDFAYQTFLIKELERMDKYIYLLCSNNLKIGLDKNTLEYSRTASAWKHIIDSGQVTKEEDKYIYKNQKFSSPEEVMKAYGIQNI